ncbi:hypothetical protein CYMTET_34902 [Cymbomonas tetramitiformis]|uniref:Uncharacterized protein n=1 Tax=Cymbomonas tetramitiformis TaxID=36881 RepID=A0AAE0FA55_9CHLO|nr:hypothetical protein CYMTET_34902 [Cymbomonas tetramitiformis]
MRSANKSKTATIRVDMTSIQGQGDIATLPHGMDLTRAARVSIAAWVGGFAHIWEDMLELLPAVTVGAEDLGAQSDMRYAQSLQAAMQKVCEAMEGKESKHEFATTAPIDTFMEEHGGFGPGAVGFQKKIQRRFRERRYMEEHVGEEEEGDADGGEDEDEAVALSSSMGRRSGSCPRSLERS